MADTPKVYTSAKEALDDLVPGARLVGQIPFYITEPIPEAEQRRDGPTTRTLQRGLTISYIRADGEPDEIVVGPSYEQKPGEPAPVGATVVWNNEPGAPLPPATIVLKGPKQGPSAQGTQPGTPIQDWVRLDANGAVISDPSKFGSAVYIRDPKAPATTQPFKLDTDALTAGGDPSTWTPLYNPNDPKTVIGLVDPKTNKVVASVPAAAGSKESPPDKWTPVYRIPGDTKSPLVGQWDAVNNVLHPVSQTDDGKTIIQTPTAIYSVDRATDKAVKVQDIVPNMPPTVFTLGNTAYVFDPATKSIIKGPEGEEPNTVGLSTQNEFFVFMNTKTGQEISRVKNPNFRPDQTAAPPTSLSSPTIPRWNPKTGVWEDVPNTGRLTIGEVAQNMIKDLTGQTVDPKNPLTLDEANSILTAAIAKMNADAQQAATAAGAAQNILSTQAQGAQTGAGMLQARSAAAQNLIQQGLGVATSTGGRYGNYSGGMLTPVPGLAQGLVSGAASFATELGGGQAVFDTAVRMVQAADPNNTNPDRAAAVGLLRQIMDGYQKATGQKHPAVAATEAMNASTQNQGLVAPATVPPPLATTPMGPRADQMYGNTPPGNELAPAAGATGTVPPWSPMYLGSQPQPVVASTVQPRSAEELGYFTAPGGAMRFM